MDLAADIDALRDPGILQHIFAFLPGHWLFLGAVCREWEALYAGIADQQVRCIDPTIAPIYWKIYAAKTTLCSAAVASPATARLACRCGLIISENEQLQLIAGLFADAKTLLVLEELGMPLDDAVVHAVARSGRLHILQQLITARQCPVSNSVSHYAASSGNIEMLKWLRAEGCCEFGIPTCTGAALAGQLKALQHLRSEGCAWDTKLIAGYAARSGSIELVEWLWQQPDTEIGPDAISWAAGCGHRALCEFLLSRGCVWDANTCGVCALHGELSMLRWLRERGCPWNVSTVFKQAACASHTHILDFVIEQGEVLDAELWEDVLENAEFCEAEQAVQWLTEHFIA
jgi:hypothetical protein